MCVFSRAVGERSGLGSGGREMGVQGLWEPASAEAADPGGCRAALWRGESERQGAARQGRVPIRAAGGGEEQGSWVLLACCWAV